MYKCFHRTFFNNGVTLYSFKWTGTSPHKYGVICDKDIAIFSSRGFLNSLSFPFCLLYFFAKVFYISFKGMPWMELFDNKVHVLGTHPLLVFSPSILLFLLLPTLLCVFKKFAFQPHVWKCSCGFISNFRASIITAYTENFYFFLCISHLENKSLRSCFMTYLIYTNFILLNNRT